MSSLRATNWLLLVIASLLFLMIFRDDILRPAVASLSAKTLIVGCDDSSYINCKEAPVRVDKDGKLLVVVRSR